MKRKKVFLSHAREQKWNFVSWVENRLIEDKTKPTLLKSDIFFDTNMKIGQDDEFEF
jgi:demethoxyubiquinone hydroxylase (CLK1/Coq7/Cat5 family)